MSHSILCVEDDLHIANLVTFNLKTQFDTIAHAADGKSAWAMILEKKYDLLILDLKLPDINGLELCRSLRANNNAIAIIILTACASDEDCIRGLELGADDYITKPFNVKELCARVKAVLRRHEPLNNSGAIKPDECVQRLLVSGGLTIDYQTRTVTRDNEPIELTSKEFDLLTYFARHPGQVFSRAQLLDAVWDYSCNVYEHTVNSHINRLRAKLENDPQNPEYIGTVWGVGYRFVPPAH